jgi:hypothetical protein
MGVYYIHCVAVWKIVWFWWQAQTVVGIFGLNGPQGPVPLRCHSPSGHHVPYWYTSKYWSCSCWSPLNMPCSHPVLSIVYSVFIWSWKIKFNFAIPDIAEKTAWSFKVYACNLGAAPASRVCSQVNSLISFFNRLSGHPKTVLGAMGHCFTWHVWVSLGFYFLF